MLVLSLCAPYVASIHECVILFAGDRKTHSLDTATPLDNCIVPAGMSKS